MPSERVFKRSWVQKFMKRHRISIRRTTHVGQALPVNWKGLVNSFIMYCCCAIAGIIGPSLNLEPSEPTTSPNTTLAGLANGISRVSEDSSQSETRNEAARVASAALGVVSAIGEGAGGSNTGIDREVQKALTKRVILPSNICNLDKVGPAYEEASGTTLADTGTTTVSRFVIKSGWDKR
jgi:hypothetical protein